MRATSCSIRKTASRSAHRLPRRRRPRCHSAISCLSNATDFRLLTGADWLSHPRDHDYDVVILPGSKHTRSDLRWMRAQGLDEWVRRQHARGATIIGICGGYQMLGRAIHDPHGVRIGGGNKRGTRAARERNDARSGQGHENRPRDHRRRRIVPAYEIHSASHQRTPRCRIRAWMMGRSMACVWIGWSGHTCTERSRTPRSAPRHRNIGGCGAEERTVRTIGRMVRPSCTTRGGLVDFTADLARPRAARIGHEHPDRPVLPRGEEQLPVAAAADVQVGARDRGAHRPLDELRNVTYVRRAVCAARIELNLLSPGATICGIPSSAFFIAAMSDANNGPVRCRQR